MHGKYLNTCLSQYVIKPFPLVFRWINLLITETVGRKSNILHLTTVMTPVVPPRPQAMPHSSW